MSVLSVVSTLAIILGLAGTVPQIAAMVRRRSAAGQSPVGWTLGVTVNVLMGYVNLFGYGATTLALGNAFGTVLASVALACSVRLPRTPAQPVAVAPDPDELSTGDLSEMLVALAEERERREQARRAAEQVEQVEQVDQPEQAEPRAAEEESRPQHEQLALLRPLAA